MDGAEWRGEYAAWLYARRGEAVLVKRVEWREGTVRPVANSCHENVTRIVASDSRYKAVRGWLCADYADLGFMRFFAHSVIETPSGELIDVTPNPLPWEYPFIRHDGSAEEYADIVEARGTVTLDHPLW